MTTLDALWGRLNDLPDKELWDHLLVLADAHEELGDGDGAALRWAAENKKRPRPLWDQYQWFEVNTGQDEGDPESDIPTEIFEKLAGGMLEGNRRDYEKMMEAWEDFMAAYGRLEEEKGRKA